MNQKLMMAAVLCFAAGPLAAQTGQTEQQQQRQGAEASTEQTPGVGTERKPSDKGMKAGELGSERLDRHGISRDDLRKYEKEGMGPKEVAHAMIIAERGNVAFKDVIDAKRSGGQDWRALAQRYNVDFGQVQRESKDVEKELRKFVDRREGKERTKDRSENRDMDRMMKDEAERGEERGSDRERERGGYDRSGTGSPGMDRSGTGGGMGGGQDQNRPR